MQTARPHSIMYRQEGIVKVRVISGKHYRPENGQIVRYVEGDVFDATEAEMAGFKDRFEVVSSEQSISDQSIREIVAEKAAATVSESDLPENSGNLVFAPATIDSEQPTSETAGEVPEELPGVVLRAVLMSDELTDALVAAGIDTLEKLTEIASDPAALSKTKGIGKAKARQIREALMAAKIPWAKGGPIEAGKVYLVGDGSPEVFVPEAKARESGE